MSRSFPHAEVLENCSKKDTRSHWGKEMEKAELNNWHLITTELQSPLVILKIVTKLKGMSTLFQEIFTSIMNQTIKQNFPYPPKFVSQTVQESHITEPYLRALITSSRYITMLIIDFCFSNPNIASILHGSDGWNKIRCGGRNRKLKVIV